MVKRLMIMVAALMIAVPVFAADYDPHLKAYGVYGSDLMGVGVGVATGNFNGTRVYFGVEADRNKAPQIAVGEETTVGVTLGVDADITKNIGFTLYGILGAAYSEQCFNDMAVPCNDLSAEDATLSDLREHTAFNPGAGVMVSWKLGDRLALSVGARMTDRSDPALTIGARW